MKRKIAGIAFVLLSIAIMSVSAIVYESAQQTVGQTVVNVATITLKNSALGNLEEGETKSYTKADVANLGAAISTTTSKATVLYLDSDIQLLASVYQTYTLTVKYAVAIGGHSVGDVAATLTLLSPDSGAISLDASGSWVFDFELTTTAKSVASDQATTATIVVTAESA